MYHNLKNMPEALDELLDQFAELGKGKMHEHFQNYFREETGDRNLSMTGRIFPKPVTKDLVTLNGLMVRQTMQRNWDSIRETYPYLPDFSEVALNINTMFVMGYPNYDTMTKSIRGVETVNDMFNFAWEIIERAAASDSVDGLEMMLKMTAEQQNADDRSGKRARSSANLLNVFRGFTPRRNNWAQAIRLPGFSRVNIQTGVNLVPGNVARKVYRSNNLFGAGKWNTRADFPVVAAAILKAIGMDSSFYIDSDCKSTVTFASYEGNDLSHDGKTELATLMGAACKDADEEHSFERLIGMVQSHFRNKFPVTLGLHDVNDDGGESKTQILVVTAADGTVTGYDYNDWLQKANVQAGNFSVIMEAGKFIIPDPGIGPIYDPGLATTIGEDGFDDVSKLVDDMFGPNHEYDTINDVRRMLVLVGESATENGEDFMVALMSLIQDRGDIRDIFMGLPATTRKLFEALRVLRPTTTSGGSSWGQVVNQVRSDASRKAVDRLREAMRLPIKDLYRDQERGDGTPARDAAREAIAHKAEEILLGEQAFSNGAFITQLLFAEHSTLTRGDTAFSNLLGSDFLYTQWRFIQNGGRYSGIQKKYIEVYRKFFTGQLIEDTKGLTYEGVLEYANAMNFVDPAPFNLGFVLNWVKPRFFEKALEISMAIRLILHFLLYGAFMRFRIYTSNCDIVTRGIIGSIHMLAASLCTPAFVVTVLIELMKGGMSAISAIGRMLQIGASPGPNPGVPAPPLESRWQGWLQPVQGRLPQSAPWPPVQHWSPKPPNVIQPPPTNDEDEPVYPADASIMLKNAGINMTLRSHYRAAAPRINVTPRRRPGRPKKTPKTIMPKRRPGRPRKKAMY